MTSRLGGPIVVGALLFLGACAEVAEPELADAPAARARAAARSLPPTTVPYEVPEEWPLQVESARIIVHYRQPDERATAERVLGQVEHAWHLQIDEQGARAPLDDGGRAGPDGRFDVYLWRGIDDLYVDAIGPVSATRWDDAATFMVLDPWGKYGGAEMEPNIFHELRHASQGVDDWWEHVQVFEAEATLWEATYYGLARLAVVWADTQARPEWNLFRDDGYKTWSMYGGALFFMYLRDHVFGGDLGFTHEMWQRSRQKPGAEDDPTRNEPDFCDALDQILGARGSSLNAAVVGFARARWYTGPEANGVFSVGAEVPAVKRVTRTRGAGARKTTVKVSPMVMGTSYVVIRAATTDPRDLWISLTQPSTSARHVVQLVGQGPSDRVLTLGRGAAVPVQADGDGRIVLAITALPARGRFDPDTATDAKASVTVVVNRATP